MQSTEQTKLDAGKDTPASRLQEAVRDLVREEMGRDEQRDASVKQQPTRWDAMWLLILGANAALFLWLLPEGLLEDKRLKSVGEMIPWFGSYLFVLGYAWFKDRIFNFSRSRWFKAFQIAALVILLPIRVSSLRIFPVHPIVQPIEAKVYVDGEKEPEENNQELLVSLRPHKFRVRDESGDSERTFKLGYGDVLSGRPSWALLYEVGITTKQADVEVIIAKIGEDFDSEFFNTSAFSDRPLVTQENKPIKVVKGEKTTLRLDGTDNLAGDSQTVKLPVGQYAITGRKPGFCESAPIIQTVSKGPAIICDLPKLKPCKQGEPQ